MSDKKKPTNDKLITLTKVNNKDEKLGYVQVIDEHGNELSLSEVQKLDDQRSLRAFVRGTSLDDFAGELNMLQGHPDDVEENDLAFRNEVITKMGLLDKRFEFVKFFDASTTEKTNMGYFFAVNNNTI